MARFLDFIPTEEELKRFDAFIVDYIKQDKPIVPTENKRYEIQE